MAVTVAVVFAGTYLHVSSVIATADADVAAVIPHGIGAVPLVVALQPGQAEAAAARLSDWTVGVVDATNVNVAATAAVGSGAAGIQLRVTAMLPHSIAR